MTKLIILLIAYLVLQIACQNPNNKTLEEGQVLSEDNWVMSVLKKYDPDQKLYFTKEIYEKVLNEVILTGIDVETKQNVTSREKGEIEKAIHEYVNLKEDSKDGKPHLSYKVLLNDLQGDLFTFFNKRKEFHEAYDIIFDNDHLEKKSDL